jgi:hypothetical protein
MITETPEKSQRKKRDAAYYREYRRRKKSSAGNTMPFSLLPNEKFPHSRGSRTDSKNGILLLFVVIMTSLLIYLSAPFYMQGHSKPMAYLLASLVELSLLFLLSIKPMSWGDRCFKSFLIFAMSSYALVPIVMTPVKETKTKLAKEKNLIEAQAIQIQSLQSEITSRKEKVQLLRERGQISRAQLELQTLATLEGELRNIATSMKPVVLETELEHKFSYFVALQRVLLLLCNLFFVHQMAVQSKSRLRKHRKLVPLFKSIYAT